MTEIISMTIYITKEDSKEAVDAAVNILYELSKLDCSVSVLFGEEYKQRERDSYKLDCLYMCEFKIDGKKLAWIIDRNKRSGE